MDTRGIILKDQRDETSIKYLRFSIKLENSPLHLQINLHQQKSSKTENIFSPTDYPTSTNVY